MVFRTACALEGLSVEFDASETYFYVLNRNDGRVRVFNAVNSRLQCDVTKRLQKESSKFCQNICCACWNNQANNDPPYLIVASSKGEVICINIGSLALVWKSHGFFKGGLTGVACGSSYAAAVGKDGQVAALNRDTGELEWVSDVSNQALSLCCFTNDQDRLLVANSYLFVLTNKKISLKLSGHTADATCTAFTPDSSMAISAASAERSIAVFTTKPPSQTDRRAPTRRAKLALPLPDPAAALACGACDDADTGADGTPNCRDAFVAAAVTQAGSACIWSCNKADGEWSSVLRATLRCASSQEAIFAAYFASEHVVVVAYGVAVQPTVRRVTLDPEASEEEVVLPEAGSVLAPSQVPSRTTLRKPAATALGADNAGLPILSSGLPGDSEPQEERITSAAPGAASDAETDGADSDIDEDLPQSEQPLMQRVAKLMPHSGLAPASPTAADLPPAGTSITAGSLSILLQQALKAGDERLLDKALSSASGSVLHRTIQSLAPSDVSPMFVALVGRLRATPARASSLMPWIHATIMHHHSILSAAGGALDAMAILREVAAHRSALLPALLSLRGRLDALQAASSASSHAPSASAQPLVGVDARTLDAHPLGNFLKGLDAAPTVLDGRTEEAEMASGASSDADPVDADTTAAADGGSDASGSEEDYEVEDIYEKGDEESSDDEQAPAAEAMQEESGSEESGSEEEGGEESGSEEAEEESSEEDAGEESLEGKGEEQEDEEMQSDSDSEE